MEMPVTIIPPLCPKCKWNMVAGGPSEPMYVCAHDCGGYIRSWPIGQKRKRPKGSRRKPESHWVQYLDRKR